MATPKQDIPTVEVVRSGYQPSKANLEKDMRIDATPETVARGLFRPVKTKIVRKPLN